MWQMIWPILTVVAANTAYNICAKSTPESINPLASLTITYAAAAVTSLALFFVTAQEKNLVVEFGKANWTSWALGIAIVGLEFGFLSAYRAGWKISTAQLIASLLLTCVLVVVGMLFYHEVLTLRQVIGMMICAIGLILVAK